MTNGIMPNNASRFWYVLMSSFRPLSFVISSIFYMVYTILRLRANTRLCITDSIVLKDMQDSNQRIHLLRVTCYPYTNVLCGRLRVLFLCLLAETSRPWGLASPQSCVLLAPPSASRPMVQVPMGFSG